jgi:hypothetical protein
MTPSVCPPGRTGKPKTRKPRGLLLIRAPPVKNGGTDRPAHHTLWHPTRSGLGRLGGVRRGSRNPRKPVALSERRGDLHDSENGNAGRPATRSTRDHARAVPVRPGNSVNLISPRESPASVAASTGARPGRRARRLAAVRPRLPPAAIKFLASPPGRAESGGCATQGHGAEARPGARPGVGRPPTPSRP